MVQDLGNIRSLQAKRDKALEMFEAAIVARNNAEYQTDHKPPLDLVNNVHECEKSLKLLQREVKMNYL